MNILVTGGAGFIGSRVVEELLSSHDKVTCVDSFSEYYDVGQKRRNLVSAQANDDFQLFEGDIRDAQFLDRCFAHCAADAVIHLAAEVGVRPSLQNPVKYYDVNVLGTLRVLEAMRRHGASRLIFASSSSVYGNCPNVPFSEGEPALHPVSPYAASKRAAELLCDMYHSLYGIDVVCLRFFTVYGPRQRPDMAIHSFVKKIITGKPVPFYGDGTMERDFTYVEDIVDGILLSLRTLRGSEIINLGSSKPITLTSLIAAIEMVTGRKAVLDRQPTQSGDVYVTYADISKARRLLGYSPQCSIEDGIEKFLEWFRAQESA
jgi:UDP-glucuronate 4-epimerase